MFFDNGSFTIWMPDLSLTTVMTEVKENHRKGFGYI